MCDADVRPTLAVVAAGRADDPIYRLRPGGRVYGGGFVSDDWVLLEVGLRDGRRWLTECRSQLGDCGPRVAVPPAAQLPTMP
jgi:hypothetical protein